MRNRAIVYGICWLLVVCSLVACDQPYTRPASEPGAVLLSFERSGGIAGFRDKLVIGYSAEYYLTRQAQGERIGSLGAERRAQLESWLQEFAPFALTLEDNPGGPDNMTRHVVWTGTGKATPTQAEQHAMLDWARALLDELSAVKK